MRLDQVGCLVVDVLLTFLVFSVHSAATGGLESRSLDPDAILEPANYLTRAFHSGTSKVHAYLHYLRLTTCNHSHRRGELSVHRRWAGCICL